MSISYGWEWTIRDTNGELLEVAPIGFLQSSFNSYPNKHGEDASEVGLKLRRLFQSAVIPRFHAEYTRVVPCMFSSITIDYVITIW